MKAKKKYLRSVPYEPMLLEDLKDLEFATGFLSKVLAQGDDSDEDFEVLFGAIEKVMRAQGMTVTAKKMKMSRDALYKAFKRHKNPTVRTFREMLHSVDMEMAIVPRKRA
jgi:probable addiction module antidote protein